jgi:hypothetical protein
MSLTSAASALATSNAENALTTDQKANRDIINMLNAAISAAAGKGNQTVTFKTLDVARVLINRYGSTITLIDGIDLSDTTKNNIVATAQGAGYTATAVTNVGITLITLNW